jgi:competence protein ComEC
MIVWNPETLLYDPSFHLSFLATIAMVYVSPIVLEKLKFVTEKYGLREMLGTTLSAQLFVLPYILYMSGTIQLLALPSNMLVLPFVPLTMLLGLLVGVFGFLSRFIGLIPGIPSYLVLSYDIFIVQSISKLSFAQISISNFPLYLMLTFYLVVGIYLYKKNRPTPPMVVSNGFKILDK